MEQRRLSLICSHLNPSRPLPPHGRLGSVDLSGVTNDGGGGGGGGGGEGGGLENNPCVFCRIVSGELLAFKLYEDDICLCILDSNPLTHGHSLIIPKSHYRSLETTPPHVVAAMCSKVPFLSKAIMKATQSDSFNLLVNSGTAAGQVIFHTHFHIIPRKKGDKLWRSENSRRQPIKYNQETIGLVDCIKEQISSNDDSYSSSKDDSCSSCESMLSKN